jgi:hypothetical protein
MSFSAVHLAFHPCSKLQGISAKANKKYFLNGQSRHLKDVLPDD